MGPCIGTRIEPWAPYSLVARPPFPPGTRALDKAPVAMTSGRPTKKNKQQLSMPCVLPIAPLMLKILLCTTLFFLSQCTTVDRKRRWNQNSRNRSSRIRKKAVAGCLAQGQIDTKRERVDGKEDGADGRKGEGCVGKEPLWLFPSSVSVRRPVIAFFFSTLLSAHLLTWGGSATGYNTRPFCNGRTNKSSGNVFTYQKGGQAGGGGKVHGDGGQPMEPLEELRQVRSRRPVHWFRAGQAKPRTAFSLET